MFGLGGGETLIVVFLVVLLIFGPSQLPKLAKAIGNASKEFKKAQREVSDELNCEPESKPAEKKDTETKPPTG